MTISKGNRFYATYSIQTYEIVGKWCGNLVLAPTKAYNEEWRNKTTLTFLSKGCCIVIMLCE